MKENGWLLIIAFSLLSFAFSTHSVSANGPTTSTTLDPNHCFNGGCPTTTTTIVTPTTLPGGGANEIPEYPAAAIPVGIAALGYLALRRYRKKG